jgi:lambda family phage portal protein
VPNVLDRVLQRLGLQRYTPPPPPPPPPRRKVQRSWAGAQITRLTADWVTQPTSIDADVRSSARRLRARARQLRRDNPLAARYVQLQSENIVGPHGMALQCRIPNTRQGTNDSASDAIEWAFWDWAKREHCTVDGKLCFTELLTAYAEMWKSDGEAFLVMHPGFPNKYGFALQLLDPDQVDDDYNVAPAEGRNEVRMGVEVDGWGRPVAYHVLTRHPGDWYGNTTRIRERIPAERVIHRFTALGAGQTRGITPLAPAMLRLQMLAGSQEALLILQRTAACKMGFLEVDPELATPLQPSEEVDGEANVAEQPPVISWDAEPGRIEQLPKGFKFSAWDPGAPTPEYDVLARSIAREIAVALGVSYASLTGDQSQANFGSQRVAMTSERDGYKRDQQIVIGDCTVILRAWATAGMMAGAVAVPAYNVDALVRAAEWQPRGFDWIDPEKDVKADLAEVGAGLNSLTRLAAAKGRDYVDVLKERQKEIAAAKQLEVPISLNPAQPDAKPAEESQAPAEPSRSLAIA